MWTYILGPFLALLPEPWREAFSFRQNTDPARAAALRGLLESIGCIVASGYWYMYTMAKWVDRGVDAAANGRLGHATDQEISALALSIWATHPLTWLFAFLAFEGTVPCVPPPSLAAFLEPCLFRCSTKYSSTHFRNGLPTLTLMRPFGATSPLSGACWGSA